jgi:hypothetical protein
MSALVEELFFRLALLLAATSLALGATAAVG